MNVISVIDRSVNFNKFEYTKNESPATKSSGDKLEKPQDEVDILILSEQMRKQAPMEGLSIGYDPTAPVEEPESIKITTVPLSDLKYNSCKINAKNGYIDDYFFNLNSDPIKAQAQKIVNGEAYDTDDADTQNFIKGLSEFFTDSDKSSLEASFEQLVREYADSLKSGQSININQLKTTFSLVGDNVSIGQIFQMSETASSLAKVDYGSGSGTSMYFGFAKTGLIKAAAVKYATTLSKGIGNVFAGNMTRLADNSLRLSMQAWNQNGYYTGQTLKGFHSLVAQASEYGDKLFSGSDFSQGDFDEKLNKFNKYISNFAQPGIKQVGQRILTEAYQKVSNAVSQG